MNTPLLEVTDLCIGYDGKSILDDINFRLPGGAYLCIVGENGAGKSTLLKTLSALIKPVFGTVRFAVPAREIGYLPQATALRADFPASAREIISSGALPRGKWYRPFATHEEKARIAWACEKTGVTAFAGQCFRELSGGQQRRVLLARALTTAKNAVILDEPTAGLDPEAAAAFYALLRKINREEKITILMVTHDTENAAAHATHILHLHAEGGDAEEPYFFGTAEAFRAKAGGGLP